MRMPKKRIQGSKKDQITPEMPQNARYESISARLGILQVILYLSLFAFVIVSFISNTELITYRNFYYFFKDLNTSFESIEMFGNVSVSYPTANEQSFVLYRKGLAVASNTSVTVFTETGRQTLSHSISYKNPVAKGTGKYLLVYELGGTQYSLYNSYTQIYSGKSDYPIQNAVVSDSGMYAIVSSSEEYTSVVSLFSSNFSLINRYNKTGYVIDLDIDEKGNQVAVLTSSAKNGLFHTELVLHQPGSAEKGTVISVGNSLALRCAYTASGGIGILCNNGFSFVKNAQNPVFYDFEDKEIVAADLGAHGMSVCLKETVADRDTELLAFDENGDLLYRGSHPYSVKQIGRTSSAVFLMHSEGAVRVDLRGAALTEIAVYTDNKFLLPQNEYDFLLCSPQKAEVHTFTKQ